MDDFAKAKLDELDSTQSSSTAAFCRVELPPVRELLGQDANPVLAAGSSRIALR